jgi:hypothetical protein
LTPSGDAATVTAHTCRLWLQAALKARAAVDKARKARAPLTRAQQVMHFSHNVLQRTLYPELIDEDHMNLYIFNRQPSFLQEDGDLWRSKRQAAIDHLQQQLQDLRASDASGA